MFYYLPRKSSRIIFSKAVCQKLKVKYWLIMCKESDTLLLQNLSIFKGQRPSQKNSAISEIFLIIVGV